jgi:integrase
MAGLPARREHAALPLTLWPARDQQAWAAANRQPDFLEPVGHAARWRPTSQRNALGAYGRWLAWLLEQGVALANEAPMARITPERFKDYVVFLRERRAPCTVVGYLSWFCMLCKAMFPEGDWRWLQQAHNNLKRQAKPTRDKRSRMVPAQGLLQLGHDLMEHAGTVLDDASVATTRPRLRVAAARDFRDGLMIVLLAQRPLRVTNFLGITIGRHLRRSGDRVTLSIAGEETKTRRPIETPWPAALIPNLDRYLEEVRPILMAARVPVDPARPPRPAGATLWVGQGGTPLTPGGLSKALQRHTRRRFGRYVNAHLFRDCLATTVANEDPDHAHIAQHMLHHTKLATTERSYILTDSRLALRRHHDLMAKLRKAARQRLRARAENAP